MLSCSESSLVCHWPSGAGPYCIKCGYVRSDLVETTAEVKSKWKDEFEDAGEEYIPVPLVRLPIRKTVVVDDKNYGTIVIDSQAGDSKSSVVSSGSSSKPDPGSD
jgi:hypothetical protein